MEGNVITGPFATGIALTARNSVVTRNRVTLDDGTGITTLSFDDEYYGADARIFDNSIYTTGLYFDGPLYPFAPVPNPAPNTNTNLEQNTFRGGGAWRIENWVNQNDPPFYLLLSIDELRYVLRDVIVPAR